MNVVKIPLEGGAASQTPKRIVVHSMGENIYDGEQGKSLPAVDFIRKIGLSVHAFITPGGDVIRCREDLQGAFHAKGFNTDSLGVEFLVPGVFEYNSFIERIKTEYLTDAQFAAGVELIQHWKQSYMIDDIDRHSDLSPGRKFDPGAGFPWEALCAELI